MPLQSLRYPKRADLWPVGASREKASRAPGTLWSPSLPVPSSPQPAIDRTFSGPNQFSEPGTSPFFAKGM